MGKCCVAETISEGEIPSAFIESTELNSSGSNDLAFLAIRAIREIICNRSVRLFVLISAVKPISNIVE